MANSFQSWTWNTGDPLYRLVTIDFLSQDEVHLYDDGVEVPFTWDSSSQISFSAPANGSVMSLKRETDIDLRNVDFEDGNGLSEEDLDNSALQLFYKLQELAEAQLDGVVYDAADNKQNAQSKVIKNVADGVNNNDAVNVGQLQAAAIGKVPLDGITDRLDTLESDVDELEGEMSNKASASALTSHQSSGDHDERYYTEAEVDALIGAVSIYDSLKPQCINIGASGGILGAGTGLQPQLLGAATNIKGNTQNGIDLTVFTISQDINLPAAPPNRRSTVILKNPATADLTSAANVDYACQRYQRGDSFDITKNALLTFDTDFTDKYGNTVTAIGNGHVSGGKYVGDGTGDGFKIATISTLGQDKWCIEGVFTFGRSALNAEMLIASKAEYGIRLYRTASNVLILNLSSNGSSFSIAEVVSGSKNDYAIGTPYHICIEFDGLAYKVYVDGVLDITVTSSAKIHSALGSLLFGITYNESQYSFQGTIDNVRVTIGNTRYGVTGFTPDASPTPDAYWFDTKNGIMKYGSPASWTELASAIAVGEITTNASAVTDVQTYAYNREYSKNDAATTSGNAYTVTHNLGYDGLHQLIVEENSVLKVKNFTKTTGMAGTFSSTYTGTSKIRLVGA